MFGIINYKLFVLSAILLNLTPGSDTIYILGKGVSQGKKSAIISAFGISTGCLIHTVLAAFGLSKILAKSILAFNIIKWLGAAYLVYLGVKSIRSKGVVIKDNGDLKLLSSKRIFFEGVLTNSLNPKVALFFLSFLPQFIAPNNSFGALPFLVLGLTFVMTGTLWCQILALFSASMTNHMKKNQKISSLLNKIAGVVFVAMGIKLLGAKNQV